MKPSSSSSPPSRSPPPAWLSASSPLSDRDSPYVWSQHQEHNQVRLQPLRTAARNTPTSKLLGAVLHQFAQPYIQEHTRIATARRSLVVYRREWVQQFAAVVPHERREQYGPLTSGSSSHSSSEATS